MSENKKQTLYVSGMHCAACELIVEKTLLKQDGVQSANASLGSGQATVEITESKYLNIKNINDKLQKHGYKLSEHPAYSTKEPWFTETKDGKLSFNGKKLTKVFKTLGIVGVLLILFYYIETLQLGRFISVDANSSLPAFFILGLVAGASSCAALIGGLLLSLTKHWNSRYGGAEKTKRFIPHAQFHAGRLASFFILGGVLGKVGEGAALTNASFFSVLVLLISVVMFVLALQMLGVQWAYKFTPRLPKFMTRAASSDQRSGGAAPLLTGAGTFFLPCGFTLIAQGVALTTGSFLSGGLVMLFFALGTLPLLLGISVTGVSMTSKPHLTAKFSTIAGLLIVFFAFYTANGQLNVLGYPSLSSLFSNPASETATVDSSAIPTNTGQQVVGLVAKEFSYIPTGDTTFAANTPTQLVVDNQGVLGCGAFIASRGLIDGYVALERGVNTIDLGSPAPGTYRITCSMGMVPPVTINFQ